MQQVTVTGQVLPPGCSAGDGRGGTPFCGRVPDCHAVDPAGQRAATAGSA
jgi:hypothetical protein